MLFTDLIYHFWKSRYEPFLGVGIFCIGLNPTYLGCWQMTEKLLSKAFYMILKTVFIENLKIVLQINDEISV